MKRSTSRSPPAITRASVIGLRTPTDSVKPSFTPRNPTPGSVSSLLYFKALPAIFSNGRTRRMSLFLAYISTIAVRATSPELIFDASTMVKAMEQTPHVAMRCCTHGEPRRQHVIVVDSPAVLANASAVRLAAAHSSQSLARSHCDGPGHHHPTT